MIKLNTTPTADLAVVIADTMENLNAQLDDLTPDNTTDSRESIVRTIRSADATVTSLKAQAKAILAAAADYEALSAMLKDDIVADMQENDVKTEVHGDFKLTRCKSPATVDVDIAPEDLPEDYQRITVSADKRGLTKALKQGVSIEGVHLKQGEHLRIGIAPTK